MAYNRYMIEMTLEQVNAAITALSVRMDEKRELYYKCEQAGDKAGMMRLYGDYIAMKGAKIQLEQANYVRFEEDIA